MENKQINSTFLSGGDLEVNRIGFGAMRITGPPVFGMPENPKTSIDVLRRAVELGVNFIDTADQNGLFTSEQLIAEALHPYGENLIMGTKGGLVRFGPWYEFKYEAPQPCRPGFINGSSSVVKNSIFT